MALPLILVGATAIASTAALAYDWMKSSTKQPEIVIEQATIPSSSSVLDWKKLVPWAAILIGAGWFIKKVK